MADAFQLDLAHGLCVGIRIPSDGVPEAWAARLAPAERAYADALGPARRNTWLAGRLALHEALLRAGVAHGAILSTDRGAPALPEGVLGSVSHKNALAVALVARGSGACLGIDLESTEPRGAGIERKVLTPEEDAEREGLAEERRWRDTIIRFSIKEAIYKAIDPFLRRIVGYWEVSVSPLDDGTARVSAALERPLVIEARWQRFEAYVLATARAAAALPA